MLRLSALLLSPLQYLPQRSLMCHLRQHGLPRRLRPLELADQILKHALHLIRLPLRLPRRHALLGRHATWDCAQHNLDSVAHAPAGALRGGERDARAVVPQRLATAVARDVRERHALARRPALCVAVEHDAARRALTGAVAREGLLAQTRQLGHRGHVRAAAFGVRRQRPPARLAPRPTLTAALAGDARGARDDHHVLGVGEAAHRRVGAALAALAVLLPNRAIPAAAAAVVVGGGVGLERRKRAALALRRSVRRRRRLGRRAVAPPVARAAPERGGRVGRRARGRRRRGGGRGGGRLGGKRCSLINRGLVRDGVFGLFGRQWADDLELVEDTSAPARVVVGSKGSLLVRGVALPVLRARPAEGRWWRVEPNAVGSVLRLEICGETRRSTAAARSGRLSQRLAAAGGRGGRRLLLRRAGRQHVLVRVEGALALRAMRCLAARVAHAVPLAGGADRDGERVLAQHLVGQVARRAVPVAPAALSTAHKRARRAVAAQLLQLHARARSRVKRHVGHALRLLQPRLRVKLQALARRLAHVERRGAPLLAQRARRRDALLWRRLLEQRGDDGAGALLHRQPERAATVTDRARVGALVQEQHDELHAVGADLGARAGQPQQRRQLRRAIRAA
eukprot:scaffold8881_cov60-Phaeocystis_antarctica.AAC.1